VIIQGWCVLKNYFEWLAKILGDAEHHFSAGLHFALLQFRHVRTIDADTPGQVRLRDALLCPPFCCAICYHNPPLILNPSSNDYC
jgi:hypothetical protein